MPPMFFQVMAVSGRQLAKINIHHSQDKSWACWRTSNHMQVVADLLEVPYMLSSKIAAFTFGTGA